MAAPTAVPGLARCRGPARVGVTGALLTGIGDVLILGRSCSGREFDRAEGMVPPGVEADDAWRSLWNGAAFSERRIQAGTLAGHVGIGLLQLLALRGISRTVDAGRERRIAAASGTGFAVAGVLTHQCCASVIRAYHRATAEPPRAGNRAAAAPRSLTPLLAVSAAGSLGALALFSASLTVAGLRRRSSAPAWTLAVTPLPCVLATLLTFGALPAPVGGYARPASISVGLLAYYALTAAADPR